MAHVTGDATSPSVVRHLPLRKPDGHFRPQNVTHRRRVTEGPIVLGPYTAPTAPPASQIIIGTTQSNAPARLMWWDAAVSRSAVQALQSCPDDQPSPALADDWTLVTTYNTATGRLIFNVRTANGLTQCFRLADVADAPTNADVADLVLKVQALTGTNPQRNVLLGGATAGPRCVRGVVRRTHRAGGPMTPMLSCLPTPGRRRRKMRWRLTTASGANGCAGPPGSGPRSPRWTSWATTRRPQPSRLRAPRMRSVFRTTAPPDA